jgi:hypothetical protein
MAINWVSGFIIPLVEIVFIGGISLYLIYVVGKAVHNAWTKGMKFVWKYKIPPKKEYPLGTISWILSCIDAGIGWYDARTLMLVKGNTQEQINETLWIYDQVIIEMNLKGGYGKKDGRRFETSHRKTESTAKTEFPSI